MNTRPWALRGPATSIYKAKLQDTYYWGIKNTPGALGGTKNTPGGYQKLPRGRQGILKTALRSKGTAEDIRTYGHTRAYRICIAIRTHAHMQTPTHTCARAYMRSHTRAHARMYTHTYIYVHVYIHTCLQPCERIDYSTYAYVAVLPLQLCKTFK